jgi:hypothetical protein
VKSTERSCPFCGVLRGAEVTAPAAALPPYARGVSRAALVLASAAALAACGKEGGGLTAPVYGGPPVLDPPAQTTAADAAAPAPVSDAGKK